MLHKTGRPASGEEWTDARIQWLKELWLEGKSTGEIVTIMGGVTRNAVIGKVHRLKLSPRSTVVAHPRPHGNKGQPKANAIVHRVAAKKVQAPKVLPVSDELPVVNDIIGIRDTLKLTAHTCKYPIGDPLEKASFGYCGQPPKEGSPYCDEHHQRTHMGVSE